MCGIFGLIAKDTEEFGRGFVERSLSQLARCSESRGKDSAGFAFRDEVSRSISVLKADMPISSLMRLPAYTGVLDSHLARATAQPNRPDHNLITVIGHSRLVTNGTQLKDVNNQPVVKCGLAGVHNGIIVNEGQLWQLMPETERQYDIDTEALLALFRHYDETYHSSARAMAATLGQVFGTVSTAFFVDDRDELVLATNNGSLYLMSDSKNVCFFASERYTLETIRKAAGGRGPLAHLEVLPVIPTSGWVISLSDLNMTPFTSEDPGPGAAPAVTVPPYTITVDALKSETSDKSLLVDFRDIATNPAAAQERKLLEYNLERINHLRRCLRCVLPETFPFITFDGAGICNYCNNYRIKNQPRPLDDLMRLVEPYRRTDGSHDCIVPFSGGRDSTFVLHMIKTVLDMNPIALTYDWGMVTDLARRNIARVCGTLGVEHVIAAADITTKRHNINKNISAWLKRPSLGMIPLFMSGDKYFFYYTNRLKKQTGIQLNIWGINSLENTDFKTGFAGVAPVFDKKRIYSLSLAGQLRFFGYVASNVLHNPSLINSSNLDSLGSIASRYLYPKKDYYSFFDYYRWNEQEVEEVICREYDWERAIDTNSTWRIGDGTASFYNYIYCTVAGFSENDTFRSNQIREGLMSREDALVKVVEENRPRYDNLKWYLEIVGIDFERTIKTINQIPKLYA